MFFYVELKIIVTMLNEKTSLSQAIRAMRHNVPALAAGGDLEPQNCHAKQMQFRI